MGIFGPWGEYYKKVENFSKKPDSLANDDESVFGRFECVQYTESTGWNDWHFVTIYHMYGNNFFWKNRATQWSLTADMHDEEDRQTSHHGKHHGHHGHKGDHHRHHGLIFSFALAALVAIHMWHIKAKIGCLRQISTLRKEQEKAATAQPAPVVIVPNSLNYSFVESFEDIDKVDQNMLARVQYEELTGSQFAAADNDDDLYS